MYLPVLFVIAFVGTTFAVSCIDHPGLFQSPIDINTSNVVEKNIGQLGWSKGYNQMPIDVFLTCNGQTFNLEVTTKFPLEISFSMYPIKYEFSQLHFHWGDNNYQGSEHTVNNKSYPIEMHAVHSQTEDPALPRYIVVGYFFTLANQVNSGLEAIAEVALESAIKLDIPILVKKFKFSEFFSYSPFSYYTYQGSLTTPPFEESVRWIVVKEPLIITRRQLEIFHEAAQFQLGMLNNYRCPQDLENRTVIYNK